MLKELRSIALVTIALLIGLMVALQTNSVRQYLLQKGKETLQNQQGITLEVGEVAGFLPFYLTINDISIKKNNTLIAKAETLSITFSPFGLLWKHLIFNDVKLQNVTLFELPAYKGDCCSEKSFDWKITFQNITIKNLLLTEEFVQYSKANWMKPKGTSSITLDVQGKGALNFNSNYYLFKLAFYPTDYHRGPSQISFYTSLKNEIVFIQTGFEESANGVLSDIFELPPHPGFEFRFSGSAPLQSWNHLLTNNPSRGDFPIDGDIILEFWQKDKINLQEYSNLLNYPLKLQTRIHLTTDQTFSFHDVCLVSEFLTLKGSITFDKQYKLKSSQLKADLDLNQIGKAFELPISGNIKGATVFEGYLTHPHIITEFHGEDVSLYGKPITHLLGSISSSIKEHEMDALIINQAKIDDVPITIEAEIHKSEGHDINFSHIALLTTQASLQGSLKLLMPSKLFIGTLSGHAEDLNFLAKILKIPLKGSANLLLKFEPYVNLSKHVAQGLTISAEGNTLFSDTFYARKVLTTLRLTPLDANLVGSMDVRGTFVKWGNLQWDEFYFQTKFDSQAPLWNYEIKTQSNDEKALIVSSQGLWRQSENFFKLHPNSLEATFLGRHFSLVAPAQIYLSQERQEISPLEISITHPALQEKGMFKTEYFHTQNNVYASLKLTQLSLDLLRDIDPALPRTGIVTGGLEVKGQGNQLEGSLTLRADNLQFFEVGEDYLTTPLEGYIDAHLMDELLTFSGEFEGDENSISIFKGKIPIEVDLSSPYLFTFAKNKPFDTSITLQGDVAPLVTLFLADTHRVTGNVHIDLALAGIIDYPIARGQVKLENGSYENLTTGLFLKNISFLVDGRGQEMTLKDFKAFDTTGGSLTGEGYVFLSREQNFPFNAKLEVNDTTLINLDYVKTAASGTLNFTWDGVRSLLEGTLTLTDGVLNIPQENPLFVPTLDIKYVNVDPERQLPNYVELRKKFPIQLNLLLLSTEDIRVSGRGIHSVWTGEVKVTGTTIDPLFNGELEMRSGEYSFSGKNFNVTSGRLTFAGNPNKTTIDLAAELDYDDIKVTALLRGPLYNPSIVFISNPPLPEKEILSLIIFNKHAAEMSPLEGISLAQTFANLRTGGTDAGIISRIGRSFGLDSLDIGTATPTTRRTLTSTLNPQPYLDRPGGVNQLTLKAGKYISRGVLVSFTRGINADANRFAIEANLTRNFKLQAETGDPDTGSKILVRWKKDY